MEEIEQPENWEKQKAKMKEKLGLPSKNNPITNEGEQDEMLKGFQVKLGKSREEILKVLGGL